MIVSFYCGWYYVVVCLLVILLCYVYMPLRRVVLPRCLFGNLDGCVDDLFCFVFVGCSIVTCVWLAVACCYWLWCGLRRLVFCLWYFVLFGLFDCDGLR